MKEVQAFCAYTACFVFGSLKIGGKYSPHAYAAMMDSDFLDAKKKATYEPAIAFEGTARIGGSWVSESSPTDASNQSFDVHAQILKALGENKGYARILRSEANLQMVNDCAIYGPVCPHHWRPPQQTRSRASTSALEKRRCWYSFERNVLAAAER